MSNLNKIVFFIALLTVSVFYAQNKPDHEKIKSLKVAFITEKLDLSSKEAQVFWPIYNKYQDDRDALRNKERNQIRNKIMDSESLSEAAANKLIQQYLSFEEEEEELDKDFIQKITKVLSAKKTLLLLRSEEEFKRQLIRQYRHKKSGR